MIKFTIYHDAVRTYHDLIPSRQREVLRIAEELPKTMIVEGDDWFAEFSRAARSFMDAVEIVVNDDPT